MRSIVVLLVGSLSLVAARAQVTFSPATPASTPSPVFVPGSPVLGPAAFSPSPPATSSTLSALSDSLLILQANLQQTLPLLSAFNDSFDFVSINGTTLSSGGANAQGNFGVNNGVNFAKNLGVNAAVSTGPPLANSVPTGAVAGGALGAAAGAGVPASQPIPVSPDALRALLVLQSDVQRMIPIVNALNGGATNPPGLFTNLFSVPATSP